MMNGTEKQKINRNVSFETIRPKNLQETKSKTWILIKNLYLYKVEKKRENTSQHFPLKMRKKGKNREKGEFFFF